MEYVWEKYDTENYYFIPKYKQSYYQEVWKKSEKYISVNVFNRFMDVFYPESLTEKKDMLIELSKRYKSEDKYRDVVNLLMHQLVYFDRLKGITAVEVEMAIVFSDVMEGRFGDEIRGLCESVVPEDLYVILYEYIKKRKTKYSIFDEALRMLFGKVIIYHERSSDKTMVYIEKIRTDYAEKLYRLCELLFADMDLYIEVFWATEHFGIIGNPSTMKINSMRIY